MSKECGGEDILGFNAKLSGYKSQNGNTIGLTDRFQFWAEDKEEKTMTASEHFYFAYGISFFTNARIGACDGGIYMPLRFVKNA